MFVALILAGNHCVCFCVFVFYNLQAGTVLDTVEELVEEQNLDSLYSDK